MDYSPEHGFLGLHRPQFCRIVQGSALVKSTVTLRASEKLSSSQSFLRNKIYSRCTPAFHGASGHAFSRRILAPVEAWAAGRRFSTRICLSAMGPQSALLSHTQIHTHTRTHTHSHDHTFGLCTTCLIESYLFSEQSLSAQISDALARQLRPTDHLGKKIGGALCVAARPPGTPDAWPVCA